jgi:hypothetical protein
MNGKRTLLSGDYHELTYHVMNKSGMPLLRRTKKRNLLPVPANDRRRASQRDVRANVRHIILNNNNIIDIHICNIRTKVQRNRVGSAWHFGERANGVIACDAAAVIVGATGRGGPMPPPSSIKKRLELQRAYTTMYTRCYCIT